MYATFMDGEGDKSAYRQQLTSLGVVLVGGRARELLGINSVIPEE